MRGLRFTKLGAGLGVLVLCACQQPAPPLPDVPDVRSAHVEIKNVFHIEEGAGVVRVWVPVPDHTEYQDITNLQVSGPGRRIFTRDATEGNRLAVFQFKNPPSKDFEVMVGFDVTRKERIAFDDDPRRAPSEGRRMDREPDLEEDTLVPIIPAIEAIAVSQTEGSSTVLEKARRLYDWCVANMTYDKSGDGWGRGDAVWACDARRGNCTDFHSLFIAMARSQGIPARFVMGYPFPSDEETGEIGGYHCWAEFFSEEYGWIPVDASEAAKHPDYREYYFGRLTPHRFSLTVGRDLVLTPGQEGEPLNFLSKPYIEVDGEPLSEVETTVRFGPVERG